MDQPYDDVTHMEIWAGEYSNWQSTSGYLTVFLSTTANFTATGTACVRNTAITTETSGVVTCPPVTGARYVSRTRPARKCVHMCTHVQHRWQYSIRLRICSSSRKLAASLSYGIQDPPRVSRLDKSRNAKPS